MRTLIFILLLSCSFSVYAACPDLSGKTKICRSSTGQIAGNSDQQITLSRDNGIISYFVTFISPIDQQPVTVTYFADGKSRREIEVDPDTGISLLTATTSKCVDNKLLVHTTSFIDGQFLGIMDVEMSKKDNTIVSIYEGMRFGRDVSDVITCE